MRSFGAVCSRRKYSAAASRSEMLELKLVLAKSPSELPSPVKSKRNTAIPFAASVLLMRVAAAMSLPQVKQ